MKRGVRVDPLSLDAKLHREGRETAKKQKSFNAKEWIINSETNPKAAKDSAKGGIWTRPRK
jgi:hypothetical protein